MKLMHKAFILPSFLLFLAVFTVIYNSSACIINNDTGFVFGIEPDDDCIFDTSIYEFTTTAILKYDKELKIKWDNEKKEASTMFENGDSLYLSIGGCYHYAYNARLITGIDFKNEDLLLEKARWIARSFFDNGFEKDYDEYIRGGLFEKDQDISDNEYRFYYIINPNPTEEMQVFSGFSFKKISDRTTEIEIGGYFN